MIVTEPRGIVPAFKVSRMAPLIVTGVPYGALAGAGYPAANEIAVVSPMWPTVSSRGPLTPYVEAVPMGISVPPAEIAKPETSLEVEFTT